MSFRSEHLAEVLRTILEQMLALQVAPDGDDSRPDIHVVAAIHISGIWSGVVTLSAGEGLAERIAEAMFELPQENLSDAEVVDAFGEVANMVGGNIKSFVADAGALSLPVVTMGSHLSSSQPGGVAVAEARLLCEGLRLLATVHELPAKAAQHVA